MSSLNIETAINSIHPSRVQEPQFNPNLWNPGDATIQGVVGSAGMVSMQFARDINQPALDEKPHVEYVYVSCSSK